MGYFVTVYKNPGGDRICEINYSNRVASYMRDFGLRPNMLINHEFRDIFIAALRNIEHRIAHLVCFQFDVEWSNDSHRRRMMDQVDPYDSANVANLLELEPFYPEDMDKDERAHELDMLKYCRYVVMVYLRWYRDWESRHDPDLKWVIHTDD